LIVVVAAGILLSFERIAYVLISRRPEAFRAICRSTAGHYLHNEPTIAVRRLFYVFKALQVSVFVGWCFYFGHGSFFAVRRGLASVALGLTALIIGQILNWAVFYHLGTLGVFYGNRFGYELPTYRYFPFSLFDHPQYLGTVASIWGFFIITRFPSPDWYVLPAVETFYYGVGAVLEH
jgi:phosphatidyl-N-methylethanolamine N-methyltransferase